MKFITLLAFLVVIGKISISPVSAAGWTEFDAEVEWNNTYKNKKEWGYGGSSKQREKNRLAGIEHDKLLLSRAKSHAQMLVAQGGKLTYVADPHNTMIITMPASIKGPCHIYGAKHLIVVSEVDPTVAVTQYYKMLVTYRNHIMVDRGDILPFAVYELADKTTGDDVGMAKYIDACIDLGQLPKASLAFWQARLNSLVRSSPAFKK